MHAALQASRILLMEETLQDMLSVYYTVGSRPPHFPDCAFACIYCVLLLWASPEALHACVPMHGE